MGVEEGPRSQQNFLVVSVCIFCSTGRENTLPPPLARRRPFRWVIAVFKNVFLWASMRLDRSISFTPSWLVVLAIVQWCCTLEKNDYYQYIFDLF